MWIGLLLLFLLFSCLMAFYFGRRFFVSKSSGISLLKLDVFSSAVLCSSMVIGGTVLYAFNPHLPVYTWIVMLLLLAGLFFFSQKKFFPLQQTLIQLGICLVGVFGVLMPLPEASFIYWLIGIFLTFAWFFGWVLFTSFDKYPMTSHLVSAGWAVALLMVACIAKAFPSEIAIFAAVLGISVFVISAKRLSYGVFNLGPQTAKIAGFIWAGIWTICLIEANISILLLVYGYYFMEFLVLLVKYLKKKPLETLLQSALPDDQKRKKAISSVFLHVLFMSVVAALLTAFDVRSHYAISIAFFCSLLFYYDLYNQLNDLEHSVGSWKQLFSELKRGVSALPKASKHVVKEVKNGLKTQKRKKRIVTKRANSKAVIKKKRSRNKK